MNLNIPHVLHARVVIEGTPADLEEVLVVRTDLQSFREDPGYDAEAFDRMIEELVEVMKKYPGIDRVRVEHQEAL